MAEIEIILYDSETKQDLHFKTLKEATEFIFKETGKIVTPSTLKKTLDRGGSLCKKRFMCPEMKIEKAQPKYRPKKTKILEEDGWTFTQFAWTNTVLIAEKRFKWYDEDKMEYISKLLRKDRCRVFWDEREYHKNRTGIEVYKKYPQEVRFVEKVDDLKEILKKVGLLK